MGARRRTLACMASRAHPGVDAYLERLPPWQQDICGELRGIIWEADPDIEETIKRSVQPYFVLSGNICADLRLASAQVRPLKGCGWPCCRPGNLNKRRRRRGDVGPAERPISGKWTAPASASRRWLVAASCSPDRAAVEECGVRIG